MGLEAEHDGLGNGAEGGQGPGQAQQEPGEPRGGAVQDWEDRGAEPVNRDCHQHVPGDEVAKDPEEHHHLAGQPVRPPGHGGRPGNLKRNPNQNNLAKKINDCGFIWSNIISGYDIMTM